MKIADIKVGDVVVLGRNRGSHGTISTGSRVTVLALEDTKLNSRRTQKMVRVQRVNAEEGKGITVQHPGVLLSLEQAEEQEVLEEEIRARGRERMRQMQALELAVKEAIRKKLGVEPTTRVGWNLEQQQPVLEQIIFQNWREDTAADALLSALGLKVEVA